MDSMISGGCVLAGGRVRNSVLFTDVLVDAGAVVEDSVVLPSVRIGAGAHISRAIIEEGCDVPDNMVIGKQPDADAARFEVSAKGVVLVTPEMLGQDLPSVR